MAKTGRPRKTEGRKSAHFSIRITPELRAQLEEAAKRDGGARSLSQEIEARLRLSFGAQQRVEDQFGGQTNYWLLRTLATQILSIEKDTGRRWWEDPYTFNETVTLILTAMKTFKPRGRKIVPKHLRGYPVGQQRALIALAQLEMVAKGGWELGRTMFNAAVLVTKFKMSPLETFRERPKK